MRELRGYFVMTTVAYEGLSDFTPLQSFGLFPQQVRRVQ